MTSHSFEQSPHVRLQHGLDLTAAELTRLTASNASTDPEETWRTALLEWRAYAIAQARAELVALAPDALHPESIREAMDTIWQVFFPRWHRLTGPMIAEAYIKGFRQVRRDEVPITMIYRLAEEHADRVGRYFNETSTDALIAGFNTYVNRQVPKRAALERVLEAYGLTPRQMSGYTSAEALNPSKTFTVTPINLKQKIQQYVTKSISDRLGVFQRQERHNLDEQAKQVAWMWMVETDKIPEHTKKMWLTAKDEKVCKQCGPMNAKKVGVKEKFKLPNGNEFFVPGAHVNCRCQVRLMVDLFEDVEKADWDPKEHPRGGNPENPGQFSRRSAEPATAERSAVLEEMLRGVREAQRAEAKPVIEEAPPVTAPPEPEKPQVIVPELPQVSFTEKPQVSLPEPEKPQVSFVMPPEEKAQVVIPEPEKPQVVIEEPLTVAPPPSERPQVVIEQPQVSFDAARYEEDQRRIGQDYQEKVSAIPTVEEYTTYRPTRQLLDHEDEPGTGSVVLADSQQLNYWDNQVQLLPEIDRVSMTRNAFRWHQQKIAEQYDRNIAEKLNELCDWGGELGAMVEQERYDDMGNTALQTTMVDRETVERALRMALEMPENREATTEELDHELATSIIWWDPDTEEQLYTEDMSWREVINMLNIDPREYQVVVVHMDEGYDDATRLDKDTWDAPGTYIAANVTQRWIDDETGRRIPFVSVKAIPEVREETRSRFSGITPEMRDRWERDHPGETWPYG